MTDRPTIQASAAANATSPGGSQSPAAYRQEDDRRRDEARIAALQSQVDELRQLTRELASRQVRSDEVFKHHEGVGAQNRLSIDQLKKEMQQSAQARALDENRTRQTIDDLESRLHDQTRPIRSLQAHVTELLEGSRKKVDDTGQHQQRYDELVTMIEHLSAVGDRTSAVGHGLRDHIDDLRSELEGLRRDIIRAEDAIKIVDQEGRRRVAEVREIAESYSARIDELRADLGHLYDSLEDTRRGLVHVDPSLEELRSGEIVLRQDLNRLQTQVTERHDLLIDMHDDARQENDGRFSELQHTMEARAERMNERLEEASELHRELTYKLSEFNSQVEELRQVDAALHRDVWYLHEQRVRLRLEQVQEELDVATAQRRDAEGEANAGAGGRRRRRVQRDDLDH